MKPAHRLAKRERLEARISPQLKEQIQQAAALTGCTPTAFVVGSLQAAAEAAIRTHQVMELTSAETRAFLAVLDSPPPPNAALRAAAERLKTLQNG